ncbi:histidine kinase [Lysinibacillus contaminans]|uniref:Histidine kinase n=1 Tax=Lysinibacillus contaminans TaxID=1293441 RepID=A0ABR5JY14_9BACI|nr:ATP-binding protein [Lysinibacillus contaminans]KOS66975.1 histidine kinase [Lysinibacillus contaminans]
MELNSIKRNRFFLAIAVYLTVGLYLFYIVYSTPLLGIYLKEDKGQWQITDPYYKDWAAKHQIAAGDIVLTIDGIQTELVPNIMYDFVIRAANDLTIKKPDGQILDVQINPLDIPQQFYSVLVVPFCYYLLTLLIVLYLYLTQKNTTLLNILILFMLTVSLAYISIGSSGRLNSVGIIVNRSSMLLCLVLLLRFLKSYFSFLNINWLFFNNIKVLYIMPLLAFFLSVLGIVYPSTHNLYSNIILGLFLFLLMMILIILIVSYFKYRAPQIKVLLISIIIPFLPFLFLYALPEILFHRFILSADLCSLFLMLIPYSFIFTQLTERMFDMEYLITRLRYYISFAFVFSVWLLVGLYWLANHILTVVEMVEIFFFAFISLTVLFFIKEKLDYRQRKVLFSTKGDYIHQLYTTIDKIGKAFKIEDLLEKFSREVALHLELNHVDVLTYDYQSQQLISKNESIDSLHNHVDSAIVELLQLGEIKKIDTCYLAFIHQDAHYKRILVLGHNNSINLKEEELLWLELLLLYLNNFIDNTKMIEGLIEELKQMKQSDGNQLPWLNKLLWLRFEEEKYQLAQELHDTNLQEQLHIAREVDVLIHTKDSTDIQSKLVKVHEQMIASMHDLRSYCENLKPPLLDTLGLNAALEKLLQKVISRADFVLNHSIDRLYLEDERLNLMIYRLFQELLNNALKHSYATSVEIHLIERMDGFEITYSDNGVGCDLNDIMQSDSMGIKGIQERVKAFNGQFHINSCIHQGMSIQITVSEGSDTLDYDAHSG